AGFAIASTLPLLIFKKKNSGKKNRVFRRVAVKEKVKKLSGNSCAICVCEGRENNTNGRANPIARN
ncbi:MAG: hypothetical protein VW232_06565, partial [Alphaproteobacteria bacterium]